MFHPTPLGQPGVDCISFTVHPGRYLKCRSRLASGCQSPPPTRRQSWPPSRAPQALSQRAAARAVTCARRFAGRCEDAAGPASRSRRRGRQEGQIARSTRGEETSVQQRLHLPDKNGSRLKRWKMNAFMPCLVPKKFLTVPVTSNF